MAARFPEHGSTLYCREAAQLLDFDDRRIRLEEDLLAQPTVSLFRRRVPEARLHGTTLLQEEACCLLVAVLSPPPRRLGLPWRLEEVDYQAMAAVEVSMRSTLRLGRQKCRLRHLHLAGLPAFPPPVSPEEADPLL